MSKTTWVRKNCRLMVLLLATIGAISLSACDNDTKVTKTDVVRTKFSEVTKINGPVYGTFYYVTVPGGYPGGEEALRKDCEAIFKNVANAISSFDPNSEISRFNAIDKVDQDFPITPFLASVIEEIQRQSLRINRAMDPTVAPIVNLWGFGPKGDITKSPSEDEINEAKSHIGLDKFELRRAQNTSFLVKRDSKMELDLSTIGEGLAADEIASFFDKQGIENYMVAVAGAIRTKGANPEGKLWRVGIEDPLSQGQQVYVAVCPQGMAISTAGSYRNFFLDKENNKFFSHIIDPKTAKPITHRTVSVTVIDRQALVTDALDTGLLVLGAKEAVAWGNANDVPVYVIEVDEKGEEKATYSRTFEPYLKCELMPHERVPNTNPAELK